MSEHKIKTCGSLIEEARILKNLSIEDLTNEINNKRKKGEKEISAREISDWECSKSYPDLEMCYKLAYILELNPTELLGCRNFERKKFKVKKKTRTIFNQDVSDEFFWFMKGILGLAAIMLAFYFVLQFKKFESGYMNSDIELEKTLVNKIDNKVGQNETAENETFNEYINEIDDNSVNKIENY